MRVLIQLTWQQNRIPQLLENVKRSKAPHSYGHQDLLRNQLTMPQMLSRQKVYVLNGI
jgi:hypothetical protein